MTSINQCLHFHASFKVKINIFPNTRILRFSNVRQPTSIVRVTRLHGRFNCFVQHPFHSRRQYSQLSVARPVSSSPFPMYRFQRSISTSKHPSRHICSRKRDSLAQRRTSTLQDVNCTRAPPQYRCRRCTTSQVSTPLRTEAFLHVEA